MTVGNAIPLPGPAPSSAQDPHHPGPLLPPPSPRPGEEGERQEPFIRVPLSRPLAPPLPGRGEPGWSDLAGLPRPFCPCCPCSPFLLFSLFSRGGGSRGGG